MKHKKIISLFLFASLVLSSFCYVPINNVYADELSEDESYYDNESDLLIESSEESAGSDSEVEESTSNDDSVIDSTDYSDQSENETIDIAVDEEDVCYQLDYDVEDESSDEFIDETVIEVETEDLTFVPCEASGVALNPDNFPDAAFRDWISSNVDTDQDDFLTSGEIENVTQINCCDSYIEDLTGIKVFTRLQCLYCTNNLLQSLDVSNLRSLEYLDCSGNIISSLNVSGCIKLKHGTDVGWGWWPNGSCPYTILI